jgi:peroxiredoxin
MKQLEVGAEAPDFQLNGPDGRVFRLRTLLKDGPLTLVFYKVSCPTCQLALPHLQRIHAEGSARLLLISQDEPAETRASLKHFAITMDVAVDEHPYDVSNAYGLHHVPGLFTVERDQLIQLSDYGFSKATLSTIAGHEMFRPDDGIPATRPG